MTDKTTMTNNDKRVMRIIYDICRNHGGESFALEAEIIDLCASSMILESKAKFSIDALKRLGLIEQASEQNGKLYYRLTSDGKDWLFANQEK